MTPVLAALPIRIGALTGRATLARAGNVVPFTPAWNVTGQPAAQLEQATSFPDRRPSL